MLGFGAKAHDAFDAGAVVPGAVEKYHFPASWKMLDIALEVPGGGFAWRRLLERNGACTAGVEVLVEAFDRSAFTCGVAAFEKDNVALSGFFGPILEFQQLNL